MSAVVLCRMPYRRPDDTLMLCQLLADHPAAHHSWWTCQVADQVEAEQSKLRETAASVLDTTPAGIQALMDALAAGRYDQYLEALLATAHNRKRARRGTPGFAVQVPTTPRLS